MLLGTFFYNKMANFCHQKNLLGLSTFHHKFIYIIKSIGSKCGPIYSSTEVITNPNVGFKRVRQLQ